MELTDRLGLDEREHNFVRRALADMAFIRAFETEAQALTHQSPPIVLGSMHLCAGQEAVPVGAMAALRDDDQVICTYRGHGWALASGVDPEAALAEICQRTGSVNGGRGGSAYMMAPHTRFIGENSIVGAGTTIACGAALANVSQGNGRVVIVTIGDGAMNQGAVHEAMAFAAARRLPVIFVVENNGWSELTATSDMFTIERLASRAKAYGFPSATISGVDPIAVRDSVAMAATRARAGEGPSLLEFRVPRLWGHYNRDIEHYRSKADRAAAAANDPIDLMSRRVVVSGFLTDENVEALVSDQKERAATLVAGVLDLPSPDPATAAAHVIADPISASPNIVETRTMSYIEAVNHALRNELTERSNLVIYGEDVGKAGGIFAATRNLQREFGADRVFDTPIAENAILGSAVGAALCGLRPVVEIMWADFLFVAIDQLINQAANIRYVTEGRSNVPLVVRMQQGATPGSCSQHSQSIEAILAHIPGLKVALAASAHDAYTLLRAAVADPDPCIVIEARSLYSEKGEVTLTDSAESVGLARWRREGKDALVISWGAMVPRAIAAAETLDEEGWSVGVLDLRWLSPIDETSLAAAAANYSNILVVHEAVRSGGFGAEIVARLHELTREKDRQIARLATPDVRIPAAPILQQALIPDAAKIAATLREMLN